MFAVEASPAGGVRVRKLSDAVQANWAILEDDGVISPWTIVAVEDRMDLAVEKQKQVKIILRKGE